MLLSINFMKKLKWEKQPREWEIANCYEGYQNKGKRYHETTKMIIQKI